MWLATDAGKNAHRTLRPPRPLSYWLYGYAAFVSVRFLWAPPQSRFYLLVASPTEGRVDAGTLRVAASWAVLGVCVGSSLVVAPPSPRRPLPPPTPHVRTPPPRASNGISSAGHRGREGVCAVGRGGVGCGTPLA